MSYRIWVNDARTVLIRMWESGEVEIATRETAAHTWGPPIAMKEEGQISATHTMPKAEVTS